VSVGEECRELALVGPAHTPSPAGRLETGYDTIRGNAIVRPGVEPAEVAASMSLFAKEVLPQFRRRDNMQAWRYRAFDSIDIEC
jgi:hypothetical protein